MDKIRPNVIEQFDIGGLQYSLAVYSLMNVLRKAKPELILCMGESVSQEVNYLKKYFGNILHLPTEVGHQLYMENVDIRARLLLEILKGRTNCLFVDDYVKGGLKTGQLPHTFKHAGVPYKAIILGAHRSYYPRENIQIISSSPKLVNALINRAKLIHGSR